MRLISRVNKIIVHCSASDAPADDSIGAISALHITPVSHDVRWNGRLIAGRGFDRIGYHYVITKDGRMHKGRNEMYWGAHCYGQNHDSIAICLTGNTRFTLAQFKSFFDLIDILKLKHDLKNSDIYGHYAFNSNKTCPNFGANLINY